MNNPQHFDTSGSIALHEALFDSLMQVATGDPNDRFLAQMLAGWLADKGALPAFIGLGRAPFRDLLMRYFPRIGFVENTDRPAPDASRDLERADVRALMLDARAGRTESEILIAEIVSAGCLANDHLWSDLGLFARADLSAMLTQNFPGLAARNVNNMKWKKFFYKQLCAQEGIYLCRAPSCAVCADYAKCFIEGE